MVSDGVGKLLMFLLLSTYHGVQRHRAITEESDRQQFAVLKQFVALLVLATLLMLISHDLLLMLRSGVWVHSVDRFYLILIVADLLLMLVAVRYTLHYPDIFRYSAFVLVTVFIRFSLLAPAYYNALLSLFLVLFAIAVVYFHNLFTDGRLIYITKNPPPAKEGTGSFPNSASDLSL